MTLWSAMVKTSKAAAKGAKNIAKEEIKGAIKPVTSLYDAATGKGDYAPKISSQGGSGSDSGGANVGISQILGGAQQKSEGNTELLQGLQGSLSSMMQDTGFYGHPKVEGMKQDASGFYKNTDVAQTLF